ncbi:MAG: sugar ABC transporter substrate-binding protein [Coprococcus sp.]|nr:sugar ABC transporter substrate-binding protein [Coprococcus sp.]
MEKDGGELIVTNANNDVTKEASAVQTYVERKVDLILLATQSAESSLAAVQQAYDAGIPVICYNNGLEEESAKKYTKTYIESDNTALGTDVGKYAASYMKENMGGQ